MFQSIAEAVFLHASKHPDKLCIADEKGAFSYGQIRKLAIKYAKWFHREGIQRGDKIVAECTQDAFFLSCALACQLNGVIFVPIERMAAEGKLQAIIKEVCPKLILRGKMTGWNFGEIKQADIWAVPSESGREDTINFPKGEEFSEILYTTGTTGKSKGILLTNRNNTAIAENILYGTEMKPDNIELVPLPLSHSHGLRTCYANLYNGSSVVLINGIMNIAKVFELMDAFRVSALDCSPGAVKVLLKLAKEHLSDYREQIDYVEIGTATLGEEIKKELCLIFPKSRLYNFYGTTESGRTCVFNFNAEHGKKGCIGTPAKNASFLVTDEKGEPIPSSEFSPGFLTIAGAMNMVGYYHDKELTEKTMRNGYLYTSDIGYIGECGKIYLLGRKGNIINYKGIKINPEEIESVTMEKEGIADCACVPKKDEIGGEVPELVVVMEEGATFQKQEILDFLSKHLEKNKMPRIIRMTDKIPRAENGKILRHFLMEM